MFLKKELFFFKYIFFYLEFYFTYDYIYNLTVFSDLTQAFLGNADKSLQLGYINYNMRFKRKFSSELFVIKYPRNIYKTLFKKQKM